jgi:transcription-repair coupling factor (superfamily II helicase)
MTLMPGIKFEIAHGQMSPSSLDKVMHNFYEHRFDVLICSTIIENGLDIKNVNTMIIHKAQNFGLAQMYQLRGRVGRSTRKAYCYLFYTVKNLLNVSQEAGLDDEMGEYSKEKRAERLKGWDKMRERLQTMLESQKLGSGFNIASRDLQIRGAGNLLGHEQHGHISKIGFGLYSQLLSQAVERMKAQQEVGKPMI